MKLSNNSEQYIPRRRDIIWIDFSPQSGREQAGRRLALIISPTSYNRKVGLAIACPITTRIKGYRYEILIPEGLPVSGVILSDHVKSLDWRSRNTQYSCQILTEVLIEVLTKLNDLLMDVLI